MKKIFILLVILLSYAISFAQEKQSFGISFSGYVKSEMLFDSRQNSSLREGHFLLFPLNEVLDVNKNDINAKSNLNIMSIQTRLTGKITGPEAFGAKTSGLIEGEFFGTSDADVNGLRLRHAFVKLDWENTSLLVGQYWHPMFVAEMFPGVVSVNTGAPFQPFSRNPQIRLTQTFGDIKVILAAASQRDFQSYGPDATGKSALSTLYLRNSVLPNMHLQLQYKSGENLFGAGADYKILTPRLVTSKNYQTSETVGSFSAIGYIKLNLDPVILKLEGIMGENLPDLMMLGGYVIKTTDGSTGIETYLPTKILSLWGEISTGKDVELALFAGYQKNLGTSENVTGTFYARGADIDNLLRISPRIQWNSGKTRISAEVEYTAAAYGTTNNNNKALVENTKTISNVRFLAAVFYFF
ncbi:MAG: hypothetical protein C0412_11890 [Flavobacterium sp.]|nr:hypothetical protein [Flavobacterium sp.]